jgi:hypothetical protein
MAYAFKAIFSNEMRGLVFPCTGNGAIPFGPTYNDTSVRLFSYLFITIIINFIIAGSSVLAYRSQGGHSFGSAW